MRKLKESNCMLGKTESIQIFNKRRWWGGGGSGCWLN